MRRFDVKADGPSARAVATALTGGDDDIVAVPTIRDDAEIIGDALWIELEPTVDVKPDEDGCNCCQGGILSLLLSRRFASSNEIRFLFEITCLAEKKNRRDTKFR